MLSIHLSIDECHREVTRICEFIESQLHPDNKAVIAVSGGLDSDVVARLTVKAIGSNRVKLFTVIQEDMDPQHMNNAQVLASDLGIHLVEIDLKRFPLQFIDAISKADVDEKFRPDGLLDPSRAKCAIRTVVFSTYQDRGYIIVGTSNRTEFETGFFLPLGDGIAHIKPIIHLYKTQVQNIARILGSHKNVIAQPASAGFWLGQEDLEDTSYWLFNEGPIGAEIEFDDNAEEKVQEIRSFLSTEALDLGLYGLSQGKEDNEIADDSGLPEWIISKLRKLTLASVILKHRELGVRINNLF